MIEDKFAARLNEQATRLAAEDSRRLSLPQTAEAYKVELPADFKAPEGIEFKWNENDPLLAQAKTWAHSNGLTQEQFSKVLSIYAGAQVAEAGTVQTARNAEIAKLGTTGPARITAAETFFKGYLGEAEGKQLMSRMFTAADIQIAEKLIAKVTSQGTASFSQQGRDTPQAGRVDQATYDKMSYSEKREYAAKFPQQQSAA